MTGLELRRVPRWLADRIGARWYVAPVGGKGVIRDPDGLHTHPSMLAWSPTKKGARRALREWRRIRPWRPAESP